MRRRNSFIAIALLGILLLAAGVRLYRLNDQSFWVDEFWSALLPAGRGYAQHALPRNVLMPEPPNLFDLGSARPIQQLWTAELEGHAPPLYVVTIRAWGEVFGVGETSLRAFSVIASVAAVALLFVAVRELSGVAPALWAALLMAVAGPQVQYAQEARAYALLVAEGLGAAAALVLIERRGPSRAREVALVACVLAMALTHYFAFGTILALAAYAAIRLRGRPLVRVAGCFAVVTVLWAVVAAPLALRHVRNVGDPNSTGFLRDDAPNRVIGNLQRLGLLPARYFAEPLTATRPVAAAAGGVALLLAPLLTARRRAGDLTLWALWLWLTILPPFALDVLRGTQHLSYIRYTLLASPALYAIVAALLFDARRGGDELSDRNADAQGDSAGQSSRQRRPPSWIRHLPPAVVALGCLVALPVAYQTWWKADWRALGRAIDRQREPGDVVIFWGNSGSGEPNSNFLYTSFYRRPPFGPTVVMDRPPDSPLARQIGAARGALIVAQPGDLVEAAVPPGASVRRVAFEPGAAAVWRADWSSTAPAAPTRAPMPVPSP